MKKLLGLLLAVLFVGCSQGTVPVVVNTQYPEPVVEPDTGDTEEENVVTEKILAPIDESLVYIWDDFNKRIYKADDLPDGNGEINPVMLLFTDGTQADILAFEYYKPDRHFYFKVAALEEVLSDGVIVDYQPVTKIFRQQNGVVEQCADNTVFPAHTPPKITQYNFKGDYIGETPDHWWVFFPSDEYGIRTGYCSYPMKYFSMIHISGDTLWCIAEKRDVDHPQLFALGEACQLTRWMDYARPVYKY